MKYTATVKQFGAVLGSSDFKVAYTESYDDIVVEDITSYKYVDNWLILDTTKGQSRVNLSGVVSVTIEKVEEPEDIGDNAWLRMELRKQKDAGETARKRCEELEDDLDTANIVMQQYIDIAADQLNRVKELEAELGKAQQGKPVVRLFRSGQMTRVDLNNEWLCYVNRVEATAGLLEHLDSKDVIEFVWDHETFEPKTIN